MTVPRIFELDGRTSIAKDVRARFDALVNDLGGLDSLNYGHRILAERAVWLEYLLATQERDRVAGKEIDEGQWIQANNALLGILKLLGVSRV